jgi:chromosome segregation ATPase
MTDRLDRVESILSDIADRLDRTESRLERTEAIAESNSRAIEATRELANSNARSIEATRDLANSNARSIEANSNDMVSLKEAQRALFASQERLTTALIGLSDTMSEVIQRMDRTQAEIRGLRTETRRILERWLGEPFTDDPDVDINPA